MATATKKATTSGVVNSILRMEIEGVTPYSSSRFLTPEVIERYKTQGMKHDDLDQAIWREKATPGPDGEWVIPARSFHWAFISAAKKIGRKIPGRGSVQYTQFVESGMLFMNPLGLKKQCSELDTQRDCIAVLCDAQGRKGKAASTRVMRRFPYTQQWGGVLEARIFAGELLHDGFLQEVAELAGIQVGVGRWRPEMAGQNGRFSIVKFSIS